jgi:selenide, water dikinase
MSAPVRLTQYSHGAGCGCKIAPAVLDRILKSEIALPSYPGLLVGNEHRDDAAVFDLGGEMALISTTDFFMPIVDDPYAFGRIASANAISDVYAMGGKPILAIAILGWPVNVLPAELAARVLEGSRSICTEAGIPLAGGHSIDSPEPIFGLAVNGLVAKSSIKANDRAMPGDLLLLTKPLGVGILTTAAKKGMLMPGHEHLAPDLMAMLNRVGEALGGLRGVHAMTDVTGFGLLGHLKEMADGSGLSAQIHMEKVPLIDASLPDYVQRGAVPGGTLRNWESYKTSVGPLDDTLRDILADPQTSGGLLVAVAPEALDEVKEIFRAFGLAKHSQPIGELTPYTGTRIVVIA